MKKKGISLLLTAAMMLSAAGGWTGFPLSVSAAPSARQVEYLDRGLVAVRIDGGVYLSWRLLGTEPVNTSFDLYRNGVLLQGNYNGTNYTDDEGFDTDIYQVVPAGTSVENEKKTTVWKNDYFDIPIDKPTDAGNEPGGNCTYSANDASVADVDGDGEYEIILKWNPSNAQDNSFSGYTGNVYIDAYEMDGTKLWRIDLGCNIRAGAHYTQFIVYDFDGDGKAEMACRTAPGSKDGAGNYVSKVGHNITAGDDKKDYRNTSGKYVGHMTSAPDWLTMFNGQTGEAMQTIDYYPQRETVKSWGKSDGGNRSERYLAGVAYLDGQHPSLIMSRGYYQRAAMAAYDWDGSKFTMRWHRDDKSAGSDKIYGQGAHSLSIADVDNDGFDEVIFGSAIVDHDGSVYAHEGRGHGDAEHVSDFDNDGNQEIFMAHEAGKGNSNSIPFAVDLRRYNKDVMLQAAVGDVGRGVMANIDDTHEGSEFWSSSHPELYAMDGSIVTSTIDSGDTNGTTIKVNVSAPSSANFLVWWDGDLGRELLDKNRIDKFSIQNGQRRLKTFDNVHDNNGSKATPTLSADILGDWREEVIYPTGDDNALRIFISTTPTEYKIPTLMHDTQYRCAVAWQNVGYNQPPHPKFFVGEAAKNGNTIAPAAGFDTVRTAINEPTTQPPEENTEIVTPILERETYNDGSGTGGFASNVVNTTMPAPYKQSLKFTGQSVKTFDGALNGGAENKNSVRVSFAWQPKTRTDKVEFLDENNEVIFALKADMPIKCVDGEGKETTISSELTALNTWYHVTLTFDFMSKLVDAAVVDYAKKGDAKEVYCVSFADKGNSITSMKMTGASGGAYLDNLSADSVAYTIPRGRVDFTVTKDGAPMEGVSVEVGGKTLTTTSAGNAVVMLPAGTYPYKVRKEAMHTETGEIVLTTDGVQEAVAIRDGDLCSIYVVYESDNGVLQDAVKIAEQKENTTYTLGDDAKQDINYQSDDETLVPSGLYEYDPDKTSASSVNIEGDTYIRMIYKQKRTPGVFDTDLLRVNFGEYGVGRAAWSLSSGSPSYEEDTNSGRRYAKFNSLGANDKVTVNIPTKGVNSALPYVIECDILLSELAYGGNQFGIVPYSGAAAGRAVTIRTSGTDNQQWQWGYLDSNKDHFGYLSYVDAMQGADKKNYTYATNWREQWAHVILEYSDGKCYASIVNLNTGVTYVDHQNVPIDNGVGSEKPISKLEFRTVRGSVGWSFGLANIKAYQIGGPTTVDYGFSQVTLPLGESVDLTPKAFSHQSDADGIDFTVGGLTYEVHDEDGTTVTEGVTVDGMKVTAAENAECKSYMLAAMYNGKELASFPLRMAVNDVMFEQDTTLSSSVDGGLVTEGPDGWYMKDAGSKATMSQANGVFTFGVGVKNEDGTYTPANGGRAVYHDFSAQTSGKATLSFTMSTGGVKANGSDYCWKTYPFSFDMKLLDNDGNNLFGVYQESVSGKAAPACYHIGSGENIQIKTIGEENQIRGEGDTQAPSYYFERSISTWNVTADMDFDAGNMVLTILSSKGSGYRISGVPLTSFKTLALESTKLSGSSGVTWYPTISNLKYSATTSVPEAPDVTEITITDAPTGTVRLAIKDGDTGNAPITQYKIVPYLDGKAMEPVIVNRDNPQVTGLESGNYTFRVYAINEVGVSPASETSDSVAVQSNIKMEITSFEISSDGTQAALTVSNPLSADQSAVMIGAAYNEDGTLKEINVKSLTIPARNTAFSETLTMPEGDYVQAFLWDSLNGMIPMENAVRYPAATE